MSYNYSAPYRGSNTLLPAGYLDALMEPGKNLAKGITDLGSGVGKALTEYRRYKDEGDRATSRLEAALAPYMDFHLDGEVPKNTLGPWEKRASSLFPELYMKLKKGKATTADKLAMLHTLDTAQDKQIKQQQIDEYDRARQEEVKLSQVLQSIPRTKTVEDPQAQQFAEELDPDAYAQAKGDLAAKTKALIARKEQAAKDMGDQPRELPMNPINQAVSAVTGGLAFPDTPQSRYETPAQIQARVKAAQESQRGIDMEAATLQDQAGMLNPDMFTKKVPVPPKEIKFKQVERSLEELDQHAAEALTSAGILNPKALEFAQKMLHGGRKQPIKVTPVPGGGAAVVDQGGDFKGLVSTGKGEGGREITQKSFEKFASLDTAERDLDKVESLVKEQMTGPILGRIRNKNPWDIGAQRLQIAIEGATTKLAKGVFDEVGVLTKEDMDRYQNQFPNIKTVEKLVPLIIKDLRDKLRASRTAHIKNLELGGWNASRFKADQEAKEGKEQREVWDAASGTFKPKE